MPKSFPLRDHLNQPDHHIGRHWKSCLMGALLLSAPAAFGEEETTIDLTQRAQTLEGWGASMAWWAHSVGDWDEENLDRLIEAIVDPEEGLGLNVFRYNIGGGDHPDHDHMRPYGDIPGYRPTEDGPYDWEADAGQVRVLEKLAGRAENPILEAFSNSPPWWMTVSGCASGSEDGGPNLKPDYEAAFIEYLVDVVNHLHNERGITFQTLEPLNEPNANWWRANGTQEGCHIPEDQQARLIRLAGEALADTDLPTVVSASDASSLGAGLRNLRSYDEETLQHLGQFNVHSYFGNEREPIRQLTAELGLPLWQSETGPLNVSGDNREITLIMAERLIRDLNELQPIVWNIWQVLDSHRHWRYYEVDYENQTFSPHPNTHKLRHFTRFIRPGDTIVPSGSSRLLVAISDSRNEVILVLVNPDEEVRHQKITLEGGAGLNGELSVYRTAGDEALAEVESAKAEDNTLTIELAPQSITTVVTGLN